VPRTHDWVLRIGLVDPAADAAAGTPADDIFRVGGADALGGVVDRVLLVRDRPGGEHDGVMGSVGEVEGDGRLGTVRAFGLPGLDPGHRAPYRLPQGDGVTIGLIGRGNARGHRVGLAVREGPGGDAHDLFVLRARRLLGLPVAVACPPELGRLLLVGRLDEVGADPLVGDADLVPLGAHRRSP
jgi:hypothetical protein